MRLPSLPKIGDGVYVDILLFFQVDDSEAESVESATRFSAYIDLLLFRG